MPASDVRTIVSKPSTITLGLAPPVSPRDGGPDSDHGHAGVTVELQRRRNENPAITTASATRTTTRVASALIWGETPMRTLE